MDVDVGTPQHRTDIGQMVLRARSKLSNCTVTRLEFWQALGL